MNRVSHVTVREVAADAGVSVSTVIRILSGSDKFRPEKVQRVNESVRRLGYIPHTSAKAMRTGRYGAVGLLLSTKEGKSILPNRLFDSILDTSSSFGLHVSVAKLSDSSLSHTQSVPGLLASLMCDGLLINYNADIPENLLKCVNRSPVPVIWINSKHGSNCVYPDDFGGACMGVEYFANLGHRRIGFVDYVYGPESRTKPGSHYSIKDRMDGFLHTCARLGLDGCVVDYENGCGRFMQGDFSFLDEWLLSGGRPTAVITYTGAESRWICIRARELGVRIPEELSVMCFDDDIVEAGGISIGGLIIPQSEQGRISVEMLMHAIENPGERIEPVKVPFSVAVGKSVCAPALQ